MSDDDPPRDTSPAATTMPSPTSLSHHGGVPVTPIRLAVLDMAGTTVREDGLVERSFRAALRSQSPALPDDLDERFRRARGSSKLDMLTEALGGDVERGRRAHDAFQSELIAAVGRGEVTAQDDAAGALAALRDLGLRVALITGFGREVRDAVVERLGWTTLVDLVLSPEDAGRGRPSPDLVLTALIRLEIDDVREVAVAGDTVHDVVAGSRAGAGIVAGVLTGAHGRAQLEAAPHTHILDTIGELPAVVRGWGRV
jgi:phosphoglycolate phosphatase